MIWIGIDPGVNTGFAVWDSTLQKFAEIECVTFWRCIELLNTYKAPPSMTVVMEDPNKNRPTFHHNTTNNKAREKISQNVGSNKRDAQLIYEYCQLHGIPIEAVQPNKRGKLNAASFKNITKWTASTNSHERDAAMLVFQRKFQVAKYDLYSKEYLEKLTHKR